MKLVKSFLIYLLFLIPLSCKEDPANPSRTFFMGFTPFPYDISIEAVEDTYANMIPNSDIINHHFDNGVPWIEALDGLPFKDNIVNDWNYRKSNTPAGFKVYASVGVLRLDRSDLALYRGDSDDMPLPSPWDTYSFNHPNVKTAYLNYCKRTIDFFEPDYFNMSIEANLLYFLNPGKWSDYVELHEYVYELLKSEYPTLPVFCSITGAHLLEGYFDGNDVSQQRLAVMGILEYSDMFAISFYPYMSKYLCNPYPKNSFHDLFSISDKPLAVVETGYPAETFNITFENVTSTMESDANKQKLYIEDLLSSCNEHKAEFVINFAVRDYDQLWEEIGGNEDITIAWRDTGLLDGQGQARPSMDVWKSYFARPKQ